MATWGATLRRIRELAANQTSWTAIGTVVTAVTLVFLYFQITEATNQAAYQFLQKHYESFSSSELSRARSNVARALLLDRAEYEDIKDDALVVAGWFEDLGLISRKGITPDDFVWTMYGSQIFAYWNLLQGYVSRIRQEDADYYSEFEHLNQRMLKFQKGHSQGPPPMWNPQARRAHLERELHLRIRNFSSADMDRVLTIDAYCLARRVHNKSEEKRSRDLARDHGGWLFVAEVPGLVVGYATGSVSEDLGEVSSVGVDPLYRGLGIGQKLVDHILKQYTFARVKAVPLRLDKTSKTDMDCYGGSLGPRLKTGT